MFARPWRALRGLFAVLWRGGRTPERVRPQGAVSIETFNAICAQVMARGVPPGRAELALALEPLIAAKATQRMRAGKSGDPMQKSAQGSTREQVAKAAGVSHDTIAKAAGVSRRSICDKAAK